MSKYNPNNKELWKSKMTNRIGYKKGMFITDTECLAGIIANGGQIEIKAQEIRDLNGDRVEMIECRVFFVSH